MGVAVSNGEYVEWPASSGGQLGIAISNDAPGSRWTLRVEAELVPGQTRVVLGSVTTVAGGLGLRAVATASYPGVGRWYVLALLEQGTDGCELTLTTAPTSSGPGAYALAAAAGNSVLTGTTTTSATSAAASRASISALASPTDGDTVHAADVDAWYQYVAGSTTAVDGWYVLTAGAGRWFLRSPRVCLRPTDPALDFWPTLNAAMAALAYRAEIWLSPGAYTCATVGVVPSGTTIRMVQGVTITSTLSATPGGAPAACVFIAHPPGYTVLTTLASPTVVGSEQLTLTDATNFPPGTEIALVSGVGVVSYTVLSRTGNVVTVDRTIFHDYPAGSYVRDWLSPKDIHIDGGGCTIQGSGDAAIELSGVVRASVRNVKVLNCTFADVLINFDVGSRYVDFENCFLDGCGVATQCWHIESSEMCVARGIVCTRAASNGFMISQGYGIEVYGAWSYRSPVGAIMQEALPGVGARSVSLVGCRFTDNAGIGLDIPNGAKRLTITSCEAFANGGTGFTVNSGNSVSGDIQFVGCFSNNNQTGFYIVANAKGVQLSNCEASECSTYGLQCEGQAVATNFVSRNCITGALLSAGSGDLLVIGAELSASQNGAWIALRNEGTSTLRARSVRVQMSGTGAKIAISTASTGLTVLNDFATTGGTYGWVSSGGHLRRGQDVDMTSVGTEYSGSGQVSEGTITLNGSTPVTLAYTRTKSSDRVGWARTTFGGTPGHVTVVASANTGIVATGQAGDTSVLRVWLES